MAIHQRLDSGAWEVAIPRDGKTPLRRSNRNWTRADALAAERELLNPSIKVRHLDEGLDKWLDEYVPFLSAPGNYKRKAEALRPLLRGRAFSDAQLVAVDCRKQWAHLKPATINRRLSILRRICHLAFNEWGWVDQPVSKKIRMLPERNERHAYLTRAQVEILRMNCSNPDAGDLIVFAAFTGLRLSEMFRVTARDVFDTNLRLDARTKNGRPRTIPLHPRALHIAQRLPLQITPATLRKQWDLARTRSELSDIHWHDLRHTFASWLVQAGVSLQVVMELMGHANITMTMRYAHLAPSQIKSAVENL